MCVFARLLYAYSLLSNQRGNYNFLDWKWRIKRGNNAYLAKSIKLRRPTLFSFIISTPKPYISLTQRPALGNGGGTCFIQKYIHMYMYVHTDVDFRRCILHNWQGLMCITHKSIEILRHFFFARWFFFVIVFVRFVFSVSFVIIYLLCAVVRATGQRLPLLRPGLRCWRKFLEVFFACMCARVCPWACVSVSSYDCVYVCASSGGCCFSCCGREEEGRGREVGSRQLLGVATKWNEFKMEIENVSRKRGSLCRHSTHSTWPWIYSHAGSDIYTHSNKLKKNCINRCLHEKFNSWRSDLCMCESETPLRTALVREEKKNLFLFTRRIRLVCRFNWRQPWKERDTYKI